MSLCRFIFISGTLSRTLYFKSNFYFYKVCCVLHRCVAARHKPSSTVFLCFPPFSSLPTLPPHRRRHSIFTEVYPLSIPSPVPDRIPSIQYPPVCSLLENEINPKFPPDIPFPTKDTAGKKTKQKFPRPRKKKAKKWRRLSEWQLLIQDLSRNNKREVISETHIENWVPILHQCSQPV